MTFKNRVTFLLVAVLLGAAPLAYAQPPRDLYTRALGLDRGVRDARQTPTLRQIRAAVAAYERVVRRYPASGYADNALWQGAELSRLAWERFGNDADRKTGVRLLKQLESGYPSSSLLTGAEQALARFEAVKTTPPAAPPAAPPQVSPASARLPPKPVEIADDVPAGVVTVRGISRTALPDGVRVSIEMDRELLFRQEQLDNPKRVFFDLRGAHLSPGLRDKTLSFSDDIVREIRLGRHPQNTTRVVMDTEGVDSYSVFTLYNPYRVIVDFRRKGLAAAPPLVPGPPVTAAVPTTGFVRAEPKPVPPPPPAPAIVTAPPLTPLPSRGVTPGLSAPTVPLANSNGQFSLARQLGLGVSRIVLDPGHGGHDPGVSGNGISESELVLDVSLRLKKLLENQPGMEVVMTRDSDVFIPLEQRTAMANREGADLFLSIHANASRNLKARGVETYFLNFAANPEAEAVAARENSASGQTMHRLPDIVRAITLNNKIDESRDFADTVQKSMVRTLSSKNRELQDRGVKQAPFVVLIGAGMPSVLAEISFVTQKQEGTLLKTTAYRQQIAEALFDAIVKYQKSLKSKTTIALREH
ncbi:MAG TPA: N-acetylmuramoyl-L-alanine amidase [Vicinamibacterales bacterium]